MLQRFAMDENGKKDLLAMLRSIIGSECAMCAENNRSACKVCNRVGTYRKAIKLITGDLVSETVLSPKIDCVIRRAVVVCDDLMAETKDEKKYLNAQETKDRLKGILAGE